VIWLSYIMIPILLVTFARKRRDLPFPWIFVLFGAFIVGCGFTHFLDVVLFYAPLYHLSGVVKLLTAIVSIGTVAALVPVIPKALALRSPDELRREIAERIRAEEQLRQTAVELERSNGELEDFAMVASHDLQEPLRKIQSFGDRLKTRYGPTPGEDGRDSSGRILGASQRMSRMIEDLLEYSQVSGKLHAFE
jgi:chemotaxis family two-component system sensor kinase Cph1